MKRALLEEEQRTEKSNDPGTSDMALKSTHTVRSRNEAQVLVINVATLLKIVQSRNRSSTSCRENRRIRGY